VPVLQKQLRWILTGLVALIILVLSLIPHLPNVMDGFKYSDKLEHFAAYLVFGLFLFLSIEQGNRKIALLIAVTCVFGYGALIEFLQLFVSRQSDFWDMVANLLGAIFGALAGIAISRRLSLRHKKS
jgi:VanZ family protein